MASDTIHSDKSVSTSLIGSQRKGNNILKFFNRFPHPKSPPLSPHNSDKFSDISKCPILSSSSTLDSNESQDLSPTQDQIDLVRTSWERVSEIRHPNDDRNISASHAFGLAFYVALFEMDKEVHKLFDNVFQQARALTGMISYIARAPGVTTASRPACCGAPETPPTTPTTIRDINARKKNDQQEEYDEGDPEWLAAQMRELGARHYFYKVSPYHLEMVGPAFVSALKNRLGEEYTEEIGDAWCKANSYVAYNMRIGFESQQAWEEGSTAHSSSKKNKAACVIQ
ncbi:hypothetical protein BDF21DRAFT_411524 [Thamnidium elegans]|uniref:Globin domain-containing protein n=1 Tax=Thamnidium elegans TaxID=101142 RepID=A0A8H7VW98_9FUNG|nr:hypothetical protein INT48_002339 [Thamnidium elegans]KAI8090553.1 hypothetical protein BDF21DRAFT_411524 [Thamnidium elegans]